MFGSDSNYNSANAENYSNFQGPSQNDVNRIMRPSSMSGLSRLSQNDQAPEPTPPKDENGMNWQGGIFLLAVAAASGLISGTLFSAATRFLPIKVEIENR